MVTLAPICFGCKHLNDHQVEPTDSTSRFTCPAYPHGIPDKWMVKKHDAVQKDQHGKLVFAPKAE